MAHRCCGKSLMEGVFVGFSVRQHARPESIQWRNGVYRATFIASGGECRPNPSRYPLVRARSR